MQPTTMAFGTQATHCLLSTNVTARASGGTGNNVGVYNTDSSPVMTNVTATAKDAAYTYGVWNITSSPKMTNVTAIASGGTINNSGVYNYSSSSPTMTNVTATASGGTTTYGIVNSNSSPMMMSVIATATGGDQQLWRLEFHIFTNDDKCDCHCIGRDNHLWHL